MVASAAPAVTSDAICVRPPAARTTAVCEVPPPAGMAPNNAPPRLAAPVAISSRLALIGGSPARANARPAAIVSVKLISAMPSAPGTSCADQREVGQRDRREALRNQADVETPSASRPKNHDAAMPPPTATSGAGECGHSRSIADQHDEASRRRPPASPARSRERAARRSAVGEEALLGDVDAEQLRHLIEHDHQPDAGLEAGQDRRRDEVGDEPETQQPRRDQQRRRPVRSAWRSP